jgi:hypothetical protein
VRQGDAKAEAGAMALASGCLWVQVVWASSSSNLLRRPPALFVSVHVASQWTQATVTAAMECRWMGSMSRTVLS